MASKVLFLVRQLCLAVCSCNCVCLNNATIEDTLVLQNTFLANVDIVDQICFHYFAYRLMFDQTERIVS